MYHNDVPAGHTGSAMVVVVVLVVGAAVVVVVATQPARSNTSQREVSPSAPATALISMLPNPKAEPN